MSGLAGRAVQFLLLMFTAAGGMFARFAVGPLQEAVRVALSLSDNQMALLQGPALALPMAVAAIPLGLLIDRYSRVRLLSIFSALDMAGSLLTALATNFVLLFAARCLVGLAAAAISTTAFSMLGDLYAPDRRGRATMGVAASQFAGMSAAFALGGVLLTMFGADRQSWQWTMLWLTSPLAVVMLLTLAMREPSRTGSVIQNPSARDSFVDLWRYRALITPLMAGLVLAEMAVLAVATWASPTFSRGLALTPDRIGAIMAVALLVSGVLGPMSGGFLADYCQRSGGPRRTLFALIGLALLSVPAALFAVAPGVVAANLLLVTFMTIITAILVAGVTLFTIIIPNELRGLCMATLAGAQVVFGVGLAPVMVSVLSGAIGGPAMIGKALATSCVAAGLLGAAIFALGRRYFPRAAPL